MAIKPLNKSWGSDNKNINYVGKDLPKTTEPYQVIYHNH